MPVRGATILLLLFFCVLLFTGCVSDEAGSAGNAITEERNHTPTAVASSENQKYTYAKSLVPLEIPGFLLESREKEPMSFWAEPYHVHSYWIPQNTSEFNGSVKSLSVDVFVYNNREEALAWYRAFKTDSDTTITIQGIDTAYRFRGGMAEIVYIRNDIILYSSSVSSRMSADSVPEEAVLRESALTGAEILIKNLA